VGFVLAITPLWAFSGALSRRTAARLGVATGARFDGDKFLDIADTCDESHISVGASSSIPLTIEGAAEA
jgi:hypothetical protein